MPSSLSRKILGTLALTLALTAVLATLQYGHHRTYTTAYSTLSSQALSLQRGLDVLQERHTRFTRRVREALVKPIGFERDTALAWAADGYTRNLEPVLADLNTLLSGVQMETSSEQLSRDLERLTQKIEIIQATSQDLGTTLTDLLPTTAPDVEELAEDVPEPEVDQAELSFHRFDALVVSHVQLAKAVATRVTSRRLKELQSLTTAPLPGWILVLLWLPIALWLIARPLAALRVVTREQMPNAPARSLEEATIRAHLQKLRGNVTSLDSQLSEQEREATRAGGATRRAETELALLRIYNENLVNSLRSAIVVTDTTGVVTSFNRTARTMLGFSDTELHTAVEDTQLFRAVEQRTHSAAKSLAIALEEQSVARFEGIELRTDSLDKLLDLRLVPYVDESGAARGVLWVADDITASVQMKNQLLASEHMAAVGRISAQVAHEIRNPLSAIGLNAELLEEDFATRLPEPRRLEALDLLRAMGREIERLNEITEGYLQLARMPSPKFQNTDINALVSDLTSMFGQELKTHQIDVDLHLHGPAPHARVDPGQLRQALINIIRNSIEAMSGPGRIEITTEVIDHTCAITMTDTGPGFPPDETLRAFEPFFTTKPAGTGLGLSLTQQILQDNGGTIALSNQPEAGARIHIVLPKL